MVDIIESREDAIASYPYDSLEEGFGLVNYYLSEYEDNSGEEYIIGKFINYSSKITRSFLGASVNNTTTFYTGTFARPRTILGTIHANFCVGWHVGGAGHTADVTIKVYHYDGSTSTQIGSDWEMKQLTDADGEVHNINAAIPIGTSAKFRAGDQIKVEIITVANTTAGGAFEYGIDPQNRDSDATGTNLPIITPSTNNTAFTQFIMRIPFRLVN